MNLANTTPSTNVLDCVPYAAPVWADFLSSISLIAIAFAIIFGVFYYALHRIYKETSSDDASEYSDYP